MLDKIAEPDLFCVCLFASEGGRKKEGEIFGDTYTRLQVENVK